MIHSDYGPSAAKKWINCPAAPWTEKGLKEEESDYAKEGTKAHTLAELILSEKDIDNEIFNDPEMLKHVQSYVDFVRSFKGRALYETRVHYENYVIGGFGTSDAIILDFITGRIIIIDLKYGEGIKVEAKENEQAMLYALGVLETLSWSFSTEFTEVEIHIFQPRLDNVSSWTTTVQHIYEWAETVVRPAALLAQKIAAGTVNPKGHYNPSKSTCQWCKAYRVGPTRCPAMADKAYSMACKDFDSNYEVPNIVNSLRDPQSLSDQQIANILKHLGILKSWFSSLEKFVIEEISVRGRKIPGWGVKIGEGRSKWGPEEDVLKAFRRAGILKSQAYEKKLIGITQAKKLAGKEKADKLLPAIDRQPGNPKLVETKEETFSDFE